MLDSIQESFIQQMEEQGETIRSTEDRTYLGYLKWSKTTEGEIFWRILYYSYALYSVYDYKTIISIYIRFNTVPHKIIDIYHIYRDYFDVVNGTLSDEGFEKLIKQIEKC